MTSLQRNAPAPAATGDEGENQNHPMKEGTSPLMLSPLSYAVEDGLETYVLPCAVFTRDEGHEVSRLGAGPWMICLASVPITRDLTCAEAEAYAVEAQAVVAFVRALESGVGS